MGVGRGRQQQKGCLGGTSTKGTLEPSRRLLVFCGHSLPFFGQDPSAPGSSGFAMTPWPLDQQPQRLIWGPGRLRLGTAKLQRAARPAGCMTSHANVLLPPGQQRHHW